MKQTSKIENEKNHKGFRSQMFQHHLSFFFGFIFVFFHGWSKVYSISHKVLADALIAAQRHTGPTCGTWILVVLKHLELGACLHSTRGQSLLKEITYCIHRTVDAGMFIPNILTGFDVYP